MSTHPKLTLAAVIIPIITLCAQMQSEAHAIDFGALLDLSGSSGYGAYKEECTHEGCHTEEVVEMYAKRDGGYQEECLHEGCDGEEKAEYGADQDDHSSSNEDQEEGWEGFKSDVRFRGWTI